LQRDYTLPSYKCAVISALKGDSAARVPVNQQRILFSKPGGLHDFVMVDRPAAAEVVALVKSRALQPRDGVVLWALVANWEHGDNTTTACSAALAEQLGADRNDVIGSLNRIRLAGLMLRWQRRRSVLGSRGIISPRFVTAGGSGARAAHEANFLAALS